MASPNRCAAIATGAPSGSRRRALCPALHLRKARWNDALFCSFAVVVAAVIVMAWLEIDFECVLRRHVIHNTTV